MPIKHGEMIQGFHPKENGATVKARDENYLQTKLEREGEIDPSTEPEEAPPIKREREC